jgi:hypothetical protein
VIGAFCAVWLILAALTFLIWQSRVAAAIARAVLIVLSLTCAYVWISLLWTSLR